MTTKTYQQIQLESTPERALPFLRAIATKGPLRNNARKVLGASVWGSTDRIEYDLNGA
jgi:hypothetical protein